MSKDDKPSRKKLGIASSSASTAISNHLSSQGILPDESRTWEQPVVEARNHFYKDVPKLGNVAVSRHAQARMIEDGIPQALFDKALLEPLQADIPDGQDIVWRQRDGLRIVILLDPTPNTGAKLVKTVYRIQAQARAR